MPLRHSTNTSLRPKRSPAQSPIPRANGFCQAMYTYETGACREVFRVRNVTGWGLTHRQELSHCTAISSGIFTSWPNSRAQRSSWARTCREPPDYLVSWLPNEYLELEGLKGEDAVIGPEFWVRVLAQSMIRKRSMPQRHGQLVRMPHTSL